MPRPPRWRDLSKITKTGLSLPQYRLTLPGVNAELVLTGIVDTSPKPAPTRWSIRCSAARIPETTLNIRNQDINHIQTVALQTLQKQMQEQLMAINALLGSLDSLGVAQPKTRTRGEA